MRMAEQWALEDMDIDKANVNELDANLLNADAGFCDGTCSCPYHISSPPLDRRVWEEDEDKEAKRWVPSKDKAELRVKNDADVHAADEDGADDENDLADVDDEDEGREVPASPPTTTEGRPTMPRIALLKEVGEIQIHYSDKFMTGLSAWPGKLIWIHAEWELALRLPLDFGPQDPARLEEVEFSFDEFSLRAGRFVPAVARQSVKDPEQRLRDMFRSRGLDAETQQLVVTMRGSKSIAPFLCTSLLNHHLKLLRFSAVYEGVKVVSWPFVLVGVGKDCFDESKWSPDRKRDVDEAFSVLYGYTATRTWIAERNPTGGSVLEGQVKEVRDQLHNFGEEALAYKFGEGYCDLSKRRAKILLRVLGDQPKNLLPSRDYVHAACYVDRVKRVGQPVDREELWFCCNTANPFLQSKLFALACKYLRRAPQTLDQGHCFLPLSDIQSLLGDRVDVRPAHALSERHPEEQTEGRSAQQPPMQQLLALEPVARDETEMEVLAREMRRLTSELQMTQERLLSLVDYASNSSEPQSQRRKKDQ
jgi:hypothetical protein